MTADLLQGIRVLDFTTTIAGPYCTRMLADLGATVIKVEAPEGDMMRSRPPLRNGASTSFGQLNAGKMSMVLDLKQPAAQAAVKALLPGIDVVVENYRPGVMRRFGLDHDAMKAIRPDLVYCAISGFGQSGPSAGLAAYAPAIHAASGFDLANMSYQPGRERPDNCGVYVADVISGTYAFGAIVAALLHRTRTGEGQMIDVSMLEATMSLLLSELQAAQFPTPPAGRPMFGPVRTRDGFIMPAVASERTFVNLARAAGRDDWVEDPRFKLYPDRRANWGDLIDELEAWSTTLTTEECQAAFERTGVPCSPYRTVRELMADPQLRHRGAFADVTDAGGTFKALNPPFRLSGVPVQVRGFAAALGEHTKAVLREAGLDEATIAAVAD
ncbi:CaiB/BaiF CoA transferase family protein [Rhodopila sp.]|jgi:crotonobetainyl-CoA:carnitine CoA-transferase CaiB-like acyl-CoA transferase|uniref:CaiB/BaiF CoA transferase family protein n=1 Tax=Rhodopila sp. TaxID=2480087 RepID=UPI002CAAAD31|nr:CoA transferase [Rhodopila sp.]HVZ08085.1 CoA transferase [Rhodopila sp.]